MAEAFNEAVECLESGGSITLECDGYEYGISAADDFVGAEDTEGFISEVLGNVVYSEAEVVLRRSVEHLEKDGSSVTIHF